MEWDYLASGRVHALYIEPRQLPLVGQWLSNEIMVSFFVWGGLLFDLGIVPLLLVRRTRAMALCTCVAFHVANSVLFNIHVFPWFMIFATTLFFEPDWPRRIFGGTPLVLKPMDCLRWSDVPNYRKVGIWMTLVYCLSQCVWPLRHFLDEGDASRTERGHFFSRRMMLRGKTAGVRYFVTDDVSHETYNPTPWTIPLSEWEKHVEMPSLPLVNSVAPK